MQPVAIPTLLFVQNAIVVTLHALMVVAIHLVALLAVVVDSEEEVDLAVIAEAGGLSVVEVAEADLVAIEVVEDEGASVDAAEASVEGGDLVGLILPPLVQVKTKR